MSDFLSFLTAPVNAIGNIATSLINSKSVRDTNRANFELAKWQQAQNERMWHMNNEYNDPSNQMKRLSDAGLNPNLVYGSGAVGNSSSQAAGPSLPTMSAYQAPQNMLGGLSDMFDAALKVANIKKTEQETQNLSETQRVTRFQADKAKLEVDYQGYINAKTKEEAAQWKRKLELDLSLTDASVNRSWSDISLNDVRKADLSSQISFRDGVQTDSVRAGTALTRENMISTIAERGLIQFRKAVMQGQVASLLAQASSLKKGEELTDKQISKISSDIINASITFRGQQLDNRIKEILINNGLDLKASGLSGWFQRICHLSNSYGELPD